jgi:hypothetical protein
MITKKENPRKLPIWEKSAKCESFSLCITATAGGTAKQNEFGKTLRTPSLSSSMHLPVALCVF